MCLCIYVSVSIVEYLFYQIHTAEKYTLPNTAKFNVFFSLHKTRIGFQFYVYVYYKKWNQMCECVLVFFSTLQTKHQFIILDHI